MKDNKKKHEKEPWYLQDEFTASDAEVEKRLKKFKKMVEKNPKIKKENKFAYAIGMLKKSYGK